MFLKYVYLKKIARPRTDTRYIIVKFFLMAAKVRRISELTAFDEQAYFSEVTSDIMPTIVDNFLKAHNQKNQDAEGHDPLFFNRNWHSNTTHCYARQFLWHSFPNAMKINKHDRFSMVVENFMIFFKKFDDRFLPRNVKTGAVEKIQQRLKFIEDYSLFPIHIGYQESKTRELTGIYAVSFTERKINWKIALYQNGENLQDLFSNLPPNGPDGLPIMPSVNIKIKS